MQIDLFDFSFKAPLPSLLAALPVLLNIGIFTYVAFFLANSRIGTAFLWFLFTLITWGMLELVLSVCATQEAAIEWYRMLLISINFVGPTGLHFVLLLAKDWKPNNSQIVLLYAPTLLFSMFFAAGVDYAKANYSETWGWLVVPSHPVSIAAYLLIGLFAITMLILLGWHTWRLRNLNDQKYKQLRIIFLGSILPIIAGCIWQIIFPVFFNNTPVRIASPSTILFSFSILIALKKYKFLTYSPIYQWNSIVENMNEGILILDKSNTVQFVNHKFCEMLGYPKNELLKKSADEVLLLQQAETSSSGQDRPSLFLLSGTHEIRLKKTNGATLLCQIIAQPYFNQKNEIVGCVGIYSDITSLREAENKIKASEFRYRNFVEESNDGIFLTDETGNYADVNEEGCRMLGYSREEILSMNMLDLVLKDGLETNPIRLHELKVEKPILFLGALRRKDGSLLPVEINARLLPDKKSLGMVRDITIRKQTEEALLEKVKEMDAFIYRASHDLRGPLASITGLTAIAKEEIQENQSAFFFDKIYDSVTRLDNILQELSKLARVTQSQMTPTEINLDLEIFEITESLKHLPNFSQISFVRDINTPAVYSDRTLLIIALQNLIINSINYYDEKKESSFIRISAAETAQGIEIVVSDNGIGIPADLQTKVFEMFYRGTTVSKGSGLGLYIVKNALKKLKAALRLESEEGKGTVFTITLPKPGMNP